LLVLLARGYNYVSVLILEIKNEMKGYERDDAS
jgi:hypothetical protein